MPQAVSSLETGADGRLGITFEDGTAFNLFDGSRMVLYEFVYDPNGKSNSTLISLTKGRVYVCCRQGGENRRYGDRHAGPWAFGGTTLHLEISDSGTVKSSTLIEEGKTACRPATRRARGCPYGLKARSTLSRTHQDGAHRHRATQKLDADLGAGGAPAYSRFIPPGGSSRPWQLIPTPRGGSSPAFRR